MARRRRKKIGKTTLGFIAGIILVGVIVIAVAFPEIVENILADNDSGTWTFAFPDIDTIQKFPQATVLTPTGYFLVDQNILECNFKFTVQAINDRGQVVEQRQTGLSDPRSIFLQPQQLSITVKTSQAGDQTSPFSEFAIGGLTIDHYDILPRMSCIKKTGDLSFGSSVIVLPSDIQLDTYVTKPDGTVTKLAQQQRRVQSTGADGTTNYSQELFFGIPNIFSSKTGILDNNREIAFKGTSGALSADQKFTVSVSSINNVLPAQLDKYGSEVRFQMRGLLNIDYVFSPDPAYFGVDPTNLQKILFINVDKSSEIPPTSPLIPQTIDITQAVTASGKIVAGNNAKTIDPDAGLNERSLTVTAHLQGFEGSIESVPRVTLKHLSGSQVSGVSTITMFQNPTDFFRNFQQALVLPSNILDGNYLLHVSNSRLNAGVATITIKTPSATVTQPEECPDPTHIRLNGVCQPDPSDTGGTSPLETCPMGYARETPEGACIEQFCSDGTSAVNGCTIRVMVGSPCGGDQIDNGDGTCTNPNCGVGFAWNDSTLRCAKIVCQDTASGQNQEYDLTLLTCVPSTIVCAGDEVLNNDNTGCIKASSVILLGGGEIPNILNIGQEIRWQLVTESPTGQRTPVLSGTIPKDTSLFAGLTQTLQFTVQGEGSSIAQKFGAIDVDSFLKIPSTVISPQVTNVKLNQQLHVYHDNLVKANGQLTNNEQALIVNFPAGTITEPKVGIGNNFFQLGKFTITTSDLLSAVTGVTGAFNCFEAEDVCTTVGGVVLKDGDLISVIYSVDGTFDLTTDGGAKKFDGIIRPMSWHGNFFYSDLVLQGGEACTAKEGRELLQCNFDETGNNTLEIVCPPELDPITNEPIKTVKQNFDECLASLSNSEIDLIQTAVCSDVSLLKPLIDALNVESGFSEEFGGSGVKTTEDIIKDLQSASGCVQIEEEPTTTDTPFVCPSGSKNKTGVTEPKTTEDCIADNSCDELKDGTKVVGGTLKQNTDGTQTCTAPPVVPPAGGDPECFTGSMRNPATGQCEYQPEDDPEGDNVINVLLEALNKLLGSFSNEDNTSLTTGNTGGNNNEGGACSGFIGALTCAFAIGGDGGDGEEEPPTLIDIIPLPPLTAGGSPLETVALAVGIIIVIVVASAIIRRRGRQRLG